MRSQACTAAYETIRPGNLAWQSSNSWSTDADGSRRRLARTLPHLAISPPLGFRICAAGKLRISLTFAMRCSVDEVSVNKLVFSLSRQRPYHGAGPIHI